MQKFKHIGYKMDYFVEDRYIGTIDCEWQQGLPMGNDSRAYHVAEQTIQVGKRRIAKGTTYWTIVNEMCGKYMGQTINEIKQDIHNTIQPS